jgi:cardiolipin synthase A/B
VLQSVRTIDVRTSGEGITRVYVEGDSLYAEMLAVIAAARLSIKLESYIFADDEVGRRFAAALGERVRAGIRVQVHIDAASPLFWASHYLANSLKADGVQVRWFHRWSWRAIWRYNRRNHRKLLVVDGRIGFLGGFNIHRENSRAAYGDGRWRDTHLEVRGQLARNLQTLFDAFWQGHRRAYPTLRSRYASLITNHSHRGRLVLRNLFAAHFINARKRIWLTTPYFIPDRRTRRALMLAAKRGVDVRVLLPYKSDVRITQWAARAAYNVLLAAGVKLYNYKPRILHAKTMVIDAKWSSVGTANISYRSFFLNYELNLASYNHALAGVLEQYFLEDLDESVQICPEHWLRRSWHSRVLEFIGWLMRHWL